MSKTMQYILAYYDKYGKYPKRFGASVEHQPTYHRQTLH